MHRKCNNTEFRGMGFPQSILSIRVLFYGFYLLKCTQNKICAVQIHTLVTDITGY